MKSWMPLRIVCLAASLLGCAGAQKPEPATAPTVQLERWSVSPVEAYGRLQVCGARICGKGGKPVQLRGMSLFWSNSGWGGEKFYDASVVETLADTWHATLIRAAMGIQGPGGYLGASSTNKARVKIIVDAAIAKGMYVLVDWHSHHLLQDEAVAFFTEMATAYAAVPNVIWEPFNEPVKQSWSGELKPYHEAVIAAIRKAGSQNLVVVGSPTWSQDVDVASADPITSDGNVAYTLHFYAGSHRQELRDKADRALQRGVALFVTEWGTCDSSAGGGVDDESSRRWTDWMDANVISSANWSLNDKQETASALGRGARIAGPWKDAQLSASGRWVKAYIQAGYR